MILLQSFTLTILARFHLYASGYTIMSGSNENRNRVLRRFIPKGQAIEELSDRQLVQINWYLNSRPLKCLNWRTPIEIFLLNLRH